MKVLTIREPWASLIVNGYKEYEFRSWKTNYRGKILIHTSSIMDKDMLDKFKDYNLDYITGAIIGEVEIVDCILIDKEFNDDLIRKNPIVYEKSNYTETYAWKLENIKRYDDVIYTKGKLGLWNYDME